MNEFHPLGSGLPLALNGGEQTCEKYCVFERGGALYAILGTSVREVGLRPKISTVPGSHPMLAGLGHIRNEFLPFLRMHDSSGYEKSAGQESQMVVISGDHGPWGLLVDRVIDLLPLEVSLCSDKQGFHGWLGAAMGSATLDHRVVRVLDERALYRLATETLNGYWTRELQQA
jgi:chemotaxis signal transduction protein